VPLPEGQQDTEESPVHSRTPARRRRHALRPEIFCGAHRPVRGFRWFQRPKHQEGLKYVCPNSGMIFADKQYCCKKAQEIMAAKGCHSGAILKNNMKEKNKDKDRWISKVRAPFEMVFSKMSKRTRYRGLVKVKLQAFLEAIVFNIKRLMVLNSPPLFAAA